MSDEKEFPSDKADKFVVRFPEGMRDRIAESAKASNRSMNAEIIARLDGSFRQDPLAQTPPNLVQEMLERSLKRIAQMEDRLATLIEHGDSEKVRRIFTSSQKDQEEASSLSRDEELSALALAKANQALELVEKASKITSDNPRRRTRKKPE